MKETMRIVTFLLSCLSLSACAPVVIKPGDRVDSGRLTEKSFITEDDVALPLATWHSNDAKAVIVALHGFNDYRNFFAQPAKFLSQHNIVSYAYDQRGFGASPNAGYWAGTDAYVEDLALFIRLIKIRHPNVPIFLLGESMGGAIIINAMTHTPQPDVNGIILAAPAVWGRETMPWYQTALLWSLSHTFPWLKLTGEGLEITPSDNIEMLKALSQDPLVIKETRVDAIYGLVNLMDQALADAGLLSSKTLLLYGEKDEIVPQEATQLFLQQLLNGDPVNKTIAYYQNGYHMLLRDLQAPLLWKDIASWIESNNKPLPSGADGRAADLLRHANDLTCRR